MRGMPATPAPIFGSSGMNDDPIRRTKREDASWPMSVRHQRLIDPKASDSERQASMLTPGYARS